MQIQFPSDEILELKHDETPLKILESNQKVDEDEDEDITPCFIRQTIPDQAIISSELSLKN